MSYLNLFMPKTAFPIFHVYKDLGCGQGSGRGHRDLGPRINEMLYSHLYLNNELSMSLSQFIHAQNNIFQYFMSIRILVWSRVRAWS